jgi:hypothetical protein
MFIITLATVVTNPVYSRMWAHHDPSSNIPPPSHLESYDIYTYMDMAEYKTPIHLGICLCMANFTLRLSPKLTMGTYMCMCVCATGFSHNLHYPNPEGPVEVRQVNYDDLVRLSPTGSHNSEI